MDVYWIYLGSLLDTHGISIIDLCWISIGSLLAFCVFFNGSVLDLCCISNASTGAESGYGVSHAVPKSATKRRLLGGPRRRPGGLRRLPGGPGRLPGGPKRPRGDPRRLP